MKKSYIYANAQILAQRAHEADPNFYDESYFVHDRLGSVKMVVDYNEVDAYAFVVNSYGYTPFGQDYGSPDETVDNPFRFTGQWYDAEIGQYYLRARQYDPAMMRFISRDPLKGEFFEPLTLHKYLYCANDSINSIDPTGKVAIDMARALRDATVVYAAGLTMPAIGADTQNWDLIEAGAALQQMSPLVFAVSYALRTSIKPPMDLNGNELVKVSHWGSKELNVGNWIMTGGVCRLNYWLSGKGQPNWFPGGNQYAPYGTGWETWLPANELFWPSGWEFFKGLLGQRIWGALN